MLGWVARLILLAYMCVVIGVNRAPTDMQCQEMQ